jgi:hypothetical protein
LLALNCTVTAWGNVVVVVPSTVVPPPVVVAVAAIEAWHWPPDQESPSWAHSADVVTEVTTRLQVVPLSVQPDGQEYFVTIGVVVGVVPPPLPEPMLAGMVVMHWPPDHLSPAFTHAAEVVMEVTTRVQLLPLSVHGAVHEYVVPEPPGAVVVVPGEVVVVVSGAAAVRVTPPPAAQERAERPDWLLLKVPSPQNKMLPEDFVDPVVVDAEAVTV